MDLAVSVAPIVLLIFLMAKRKGVPSHIALPAAALVVYGIKLLYFGADSTVLNATVINGLLTALTPILIIWGAIFMFKTMEHSGAMDLVRAWLNGISGNRVAQLMIVGWAFSFLIEGVSGFGTPAALAAPILVGLGFAPVPVAVLTLIMNSVPVTFGAVGTPTWFGLGQLGLGHADLLQIAFRSAVIHGAAALVVPVMALLAVVGWRELRANLGFVYLSILACVVPYVALARFSYEFPSVIAGLIGFFASIALARRGIGLAADCTPAEDAADAPRLSPGQLVRALFPIWATVVVLLITRIEPIGLKAFLNDPTPAFQVALGGLGRFAASPSLVLSLKDILRVDSAWVFPALYVPAIVPFFLISALSFAVFRMPARAIGRVVSESYGRMVTPIVALLGALVMVKLLMLGGERSMVILIGKGFAAATGPYWQYAAAYLGAIGAFFSGSATISALTFSGIQASIAADLGLDRTLILSLQSVGGAMGNMVCINNIVAVCSILGLIGQEGPIIRRTVWPMLLYGAVAGGVGVIF